MSLFVISLEEEKNGQENTNYLKTLLMHNFLKSVEISKLFF